MADEKRREKDEREKPSQLPTDRPDRPARPDQELPRPERPGNVGGQPKPETPEVEPPTESTPPPPTTAPKS